MAEKKPRKRHLNETPVKVHLRPGKLRIIVDIPWKDIERRLKTKLKTGRFRRKLKS